MLVLAIFIACTRDEEGFQEYVSVIVILSVLILFSLLKAVKVAFANRFNIISESEASSFST